MLIFKNLSPICANTLKKVFHPWIKMVNNINTHTLLMIMRINSQIVFFHTGQCKILLVGTGGLALWAMRIARFYWPQKRDRIVIAVACLRDEGISIAQEYLR